VTKLPAWAEFGLIPLINLALAFGIAGIVIALLGVNPFAAMKVIIEGAFVDDGALGYTLFYTTSLIFTGLAVAVAFQARLFNIGGEGQAYIGGLGALLVAVTVGSWLPAIASIPLCNSWRRCIWRALGLCSRLAASLSRQPYRHHNNHVQFYRFGHNGGAAVRAVDACRSTKPGECADRR
jgi:hypothetical protein